MFKCQLGQAMKISEWGNAEVILLHAPNAKPGLPA
jgi:ABC-type tungstate transport system permease subunit